jgi:sugar lactone lactonase YvrE
LSPLSGYTGPEFFGGFDAGPSTIGTFDVANVRDATSDAPRVQFTTSAIGAGSFSFLFAMPLSTPASLSSLEVSGQANRGSGAGHGGTLYIAVKTGSDWFICNTSVAFNSTQKPYTFQNLNLATWAPYNPAGGLQFPGAGTLTLDAATSSVEEVALLSTMTWGEESAWGSQKVIDFISFKVTGGPAVVAPAITSAAAATATVGTAFTYTITASNSPTGFAAGGLPDGLALDPETGVISGTPAETGVFNVTLAASNTNGTGPAATLVLTVLPPAVAAPVITSPGAATTAVGAAFTYTITADNQPIGFTAAGLPDGLALDPETGVISGMPAVTGSFVVTIGASNSIGSDSRHLVIRVTVSQSDIGTVVFPGGLGSPASTVFDGAGNSYIADIVSGEIKKVSPGGAVSTFAAIPQLAALAGDAAGNLYTAGNDGSIRKVLADGTVVSPALATGVSTPGGIAVAPDGTVYVSKTAANTIVKITPAGAVGTLAGTGTAGSADSATGTAATFNGPTGLALNTATGLLYVADTVNCTLHEINLATGAVTTVAGQPGVRGDIGSMGAAGKAADGSFNTPEALTIDSNGLLYIADTGNILIRGFDPVSGALVTLAGDTGATTLNAPAGLAFDSTNGFLHVADTGNNALRVVTIAPLFAAKLADRTVPSGSSITLDGTAWASPAADYLWTLNSTTPVGDTATITLPGYIADTGVYEVAASNIAGTGTASMRLTVYENYQREGTLYRSSHGGAGASSVWLLAGMGLLLASRYLRTRQ